MEKSSICEASQDTAFSDGACSCNGKPNANASFAAVIIGPHFETSVIRGKVSPVEYIFINDEKPEQGIQITNIKIIPSNNRGELLGIIYSFLALIRGQANGYVELISDSKISINTLIDWLPSRFKKGTERELKNYDLIIIAWRLLEILRKQTIQVTLTHIHSHQRAPLQSASVRDHFIWKGNDLADKNAAAAASSAASLEVISQLNILHTIK